MGRGLGVNPGLAVGEGLGVRVGLAVGVDAAGVSGAALAGAGSDLLQPSTRDIKPTTGSSTLCIRISAIIHFS